MTIIRDIFRRFVKKIFKKKSRALHRLKENFPFLGGDGPDLILTVAFDEKSDKSGLESFQHIVGFFRVKAGAGKKNRSAFSFARPDLHKVLCGNVCNFS